jgi:hypothetical protein
MRVVIAALVIGVLGAHSSVLAQQPPLSAVPRLDPPVRVEQPHQLSFVKPPPLHSQPWNLFGVPRKTSKTTTPTLVSVPSLQPPPPTTRPAVVCGLTLIPADSSLDAAIRRPLPTNDALFAMRSIVPTECQR